MAEKNRMENLTIAVGDDPNIYVIISTNLEKISQLWLHLFLDEKRLFH